MEPKRLLRMKLDQLLDNLWLLAPTPFVLGIAKLLARTHPLGWFPGWHFGAGMARFFWRLRLSLWRHGEHRKVLQVPFSVKWYDNLTINLHLGDDLSYCLFIGGCFEPNEFTFLSLILEEGMHFMDVGANVGLYSLFAARRVGTRGLVTAFEPSKREIVRFEDHIRLNQINNIRIFPLAVSDYQGEALLMIANAQHSGQNTLGSFVHNGIVQEQREYVSVKTLDAVIAEESLPKVDVLKIDVEGTEGAVLRGAKGMLSEHRPLLMLEILEPALRHQGCSRNSLYKLLRKFDYRLYYYSRSKGYPLPVLNREISENMVAAPVEWQMPEIE